MSDGGKGDKQRPTDLAKFRDNFDRIFGNKEVRRGKFVFDSVKNEFVP